MDFKTIQEILRFVNKSELEEVEIEEKDFKLRVKRQGSGFQIIQGTPNYSAPPQAQAYIPSASPSGVEATACAWVWASSLHSIQ